MTFEILAAYFRDEREIRACWRPEAGQVVIDVGCAEGSYTLPALQAGAGVVAIDSSAARLARLRACAILEDADLSRLTVVPKALYDGGPYPVGLMREIRGSSWPGEGPTGNEWTTLDEVVATCKLERVDWVKVDVEGGEFGVLRGGAEMLREFHPRLVIEDHSRIYPWVKRTGSARRITKMLAELGYDVEAVPYAGTGPPRDYLICA